MAPRVTIRYNSNMDSAYEQLKAELDAKYHNYHPHFQDVPLSEAELAELETYAKYADHAPVDSHNFGRPV